jgi:hypothetical protein
MAAMRGAAAQASGPTLDHSPAPPLAKGSPAAIRNASPTADWPAQRIKNGSSRIVIALAQLTGCVLHRRCLRLCASCTRPPISRLLRACATIAVSDVACAVQPPVLDRLHTRCEFLLLIFQNYSQHPPALPARPAICRYCARVTGPPPCQRLRSITRRAGRLMPAASVDVAVSTCGRTRERRAGGVSTRGRQHAAGGSGLLSGRVGIVSAAAVKRQASQQWDTARQ